MTIKPSPAEQPSPKSEPPSSEPPATVTPTDFRTLFVAVFVPMFLAAVDQTLLATATPAIAASLGGFRDASWMVVAYLLASATIVPVYGRLGDMRGRRNMLLVALGMFALGSIACGLSQNFPQFVAARVLQGLGGGGLMTLSQSLIGELVPPLQRIRYQGYFALVFMSASMGGPVLGGLVVTHASWRWLFLANLPLVAFAAWRLRQLPPGERHAPATAGTDIPGHVLFVVATVSTLFWLTSAGHRFAWGSPISLGLIATATAAWAALYVHERRHATPFLPVDLLRGAVIRYSAVLVMLFAACLFAMIFFLPVYLQLGHHMSAQMSGLMLLPLTAGQLTATLGISRFIHKLRDPQRLPAIGMSMASAALLLLGLLPPHFGMVIVLGYITGMGLGSVMAINQVVVQTAAGRKRLGAAGSMNSLARSTGGAAGAAVFGAIVFTMMPGVDARSLLAQGSALDVDMVIRVFHRAFIFTAVMAGIAAWVATRIPRVALWQADQADPPKTDQQER